MCDYIVNCIQRTSRRISLIKHSFKKCGLSSNLVGSEDALFNTKGIEEYKMLLPEKEFQMIEETDSEDDDEEF